MQKQIILVNDLSGVGRCSLSVQLPILSVMKNECLLLPTSLLSSHTGYPGFIQRSLEEDLDPWLKQWEQLNLHPDAMISGYFSSVKQTGRLLEWINNTDQNNQLIYICDPVMADDGKLYESMSPLMPQALLPLCQQALVITPNMTEACLLAGRPWKNTWTRQEAEETAAYLQNKQIKQVIITSVALEEGGCSDLCVDQNGNTFWFDFDHSLKSRPGTGDIFTAVLAGSLIKGFTLEQSAKKAGWFVRQCLKASAREKTPPLEGCAFEEVLDLLIK